MTNTVSSLTTLNDLSVITLTGSDSTRFLQSQLTQDINALDADHAALAGYCTAQGRVLASMVVLQKSLDPSDGWLLLCKADIAPSFAQRLRMFVLRAKVDVEISSTTVTGVRVSTSGHGEQVANHSASDLSAPPATTPYSIVRRDDEIWIRIPERNDVPHVRWWLLNGPSSTQPTSDRALQAWQADDIAAGLPWIQKATQEMFIPQTINMDLINGVSFSKGCYPGQEVVARSHYRGTVKRRMAYAVGAAAPARSVADLAGVDTFDANKPDNPCGRVINAAVADEVLHVLMEIRLADIERADFCLKTGDGIALTLVALPYAIQADS